MNKKNAIHIGYTNKVKYRDNDNFVLVMDKNDFNHKINYSVLAEFDFVPQLIEKTDKKLVWKWIDGEHLKNPTSKDLKQLGDIFRTLHKSNVQFPKNNFRKRFKKYIQISHGKNIKLPEVENNYKFSSKLVGKMSRLNPCHNDPWNQNILKDKNGKLWLVDWEYATMGDKHFDLAFIIESFNLNKNQEKILLDQYNSHDDYQAWIPEWIDHYKKFVNWLTLCWALAQETKPFDLEDIKKKLR